MSLAAWLRAARPLAHANIAPPILLGQGLAFAQSGRFDPVLAAVAFGFGALDHLAIVFANDYADREADALSDDRTPFSGGSRVLVDGLIAPSALRNAAIAAAVLLVAGAAVAGWQLDRPHLPGFAVVALLLLQAYSFAPLRLSYRGFGEVLQGLGVGVVLPLLGYYAQTGLLIRAPWDALAPLFLLAFTSNIVTALPDHEGDAKADKQTWPVRRGAARARRDAVIFAGVGVALVTQVGPAFDPIWTGVIVGPPLLALAGALVVMRREDQTLRFVVLAAGAITLLHVTWSVALFTAPSERRGASLAQVGEGPVPDGLGVHAPRLDGDEALGREPAVQPQLLVGVAGELEGVAGAGVAQPRVLRVVGGDQREQLVPARVDRLEERGVVGADRGPLAGLAPHPLRPVEAVDQVVHVAEADRGVPPEQRVQLDDPRERAAQRVVVLAAARHGGDRRVVVPEQVLGEVLDHRVGDRDETLGEDRPAGVVELRGEPVVEGDQRRGASRARVERATLRRDAIDAGVGGLERLHHRLHHARNMDATSAARHIASCWRAL